MKLRKRRDFNIRKSEGLEWYALCVPPQKEFVAAVILDRNVEVFLPVRTLWRKRSRFRRNREEISYPLMPRYVLVGFEPPRHGEGIPWGLVFRYPFVRAVLGTGGVPVALNGAALRRLMSRCDDGVYRARPEHRRQQPHREISIGDEVRITGGAFIGFTPVVKDIRGVRLKVVAKLFGRETEIEVGLDQVESAV